MDFASWKQSEHHARWVSPEEAAQSEPRERVIRLLKGIALVFCVTVAFGLLACATLALVGIDCPIASHAT
jgi:hypothetical protein